jgi:hypothetical protein
MTMEVDARVDMALDDIIKIERKDKPKAKGSKPDGASRKPVSPYPTNRGCR